MNDNDEARNAFGEGSSSPPQPPLPPPVPPARPAAQPPMQAFADLGQAQQPMTQQGGTTTPSDAIVALVLAISGLLFCPILPSIIAIVFAGKARRTIEADPQRYSGAGMVTAATVIAWTGIVLFVVGITAAIVLPLLLTNS